tara:strand:- start:4012 stop:5169 length:1158 start_codon:yes stop_codon:yes gene_type:complete
MSVFNKIVKLSKHIASSLLKDEKPTQLENSELFNSIDKKYIIDNLLDETLIKERLDLKNKINKKKDLNTIKSKIGVPVKNFYWRYAAAAIIALFTLGYIFEKNLRNEPDNATPIIVNTIQIGQDKATLTLEDGSQIALEKGASFKTKYANSNGQQIVYENDNTSTSQIAYNYLTIPRGGQFFITLADGTDVWLNSESKLKYPVSFVDGEERVVELVYGEAYFDVSPSANHNGAKFKVFNQFQEVEVLGTQFNMKAYKDETHIYTTLVEGEVAVTNGVSKQNLVPNEQLDLDITNNATKVSVVDVKGEIAWIHGDFIFQHKPLEEIMKVLSRWYDVEIEFQNESLKDIKFVGELSKYQKLEDILLLIKNTNNSINYEINDKKIILK